MTDVTACAQSVHRIARRYELAAQLGSGGAATVFRAYDTIERRSVALKLLTQGASESVLAMFRAEFRTLASLAHPNVVRVYDYGTSEGRHYYTMELLSGGDLSREAPLPWPRACREIAAAATALGVLHARRLIHRDVSPRNLWRTDDGVIKLIDFGALADFGSNGHVVGTPPCVAPEAVAGGELDQRTDLYSLGAVLYYLLTGVHAFPARSLHELPGYWSEAARRPSQRTLPEGLPSVPAELDALVESLLSKNPQGRPSSAAELADRLSGLADQHTRSPRAAITSAAIPEPVFVGRDRPRRILARRLRAVVRGEGGAVIVEGSCGQGRSRLLRELSLDARLAGVPVIALDARAFPGVHGLAAALVVRLLEVLPEPGEAEAARRAAVLAHLGPRVRERLGVDTLAELQVMPGETRALLHTTLVELFVAASGASPIAVLIDDADAADDASLACVLGLAEACAAAPLMVVAVSAPQRTDAVLRALRRQGELVRLTPFTHDETRAQVLSMFGEVPHLVRFVARVHAHGHGSPRANELIVRKLVDAGVIGFREGLWVLPQELDDTHFLLARPANDTHLADALTGELLEHAQRLSVAEGLVGASLLAALQPCTPEEAERTLRELTRLGVLIEADGGQRFAQEALRSELYARMDGALRDTAHARYGRHLARAPFASQLDELVSACHRVHDPGDATAQRTVAQLCLRHVMREPDLLSVLVPHIERVITLYRRRGHRGRDLLPLLSALGVASYYADRALLERYGQELLQEGAALLGLTRARMLQRWLGRKLGLFVALGIASAGFARQRKNPRVPPFKEALMALFACVAAICGVYTICIDPRRALETAELLEPMTALGPGHTASLLYEFAKNLGHTVQDDVGAAYARWQRMVERLDRPEGVPGVDDLIRLRYLYGGLYAMGVLECWRDGDGGLAIAERLERSDIALYRLSADQLRSVYYANRGNLARYEHYRGRAELHAVKRGTAWQVEVWAPMAAITPCQRLYDVMGIKHAVEQLERLARSVQSLDQGLSRARGTYELLRKRYEVALSELAHVESEEPRYVVGWGRMVGALARTYNALGRHGEGLAAAERAIARLTPEDRTFAAMNLGLELERVYALIGLGQAERAEVFLEELEQLHAVSENPLTRGALAEARVRLALGRRDEQAARAAFAELEVHFLGTAAPSLVARTEGIQRELERSFRVHAPRTSSDASATDAGTGVGVTVIEHALSELAPVERRARALGLVLKAAQSERGALCLLEAGTPRVCSASHGFRLAKELSDWVLARVRALHDEHLDVTESDDGDEEDPNLYELGRTRYRLLPLRCTDSVQDGLLGAVLVEEAQIGAAMVSPYVLEAVARRLREPASAVASVLE